MDKQATPNKSIAFTVQQQQPVTEETAINHTVALSLMQFQRISSSTETDYRQLEFVDQRTGAYAAVRKHISQLLADERAHA